jgi:hypothetical protein
MEKLTRKERTHSLYLTPENVIKLADLAKQKHVSKNYIVNEALRRLFAGNKN